MAAMAAAASKSLLNRVAPRKNPTVTPWNVPVLVLA
jgi:hypothetical protein